MIFFFYGTLMDPQVRGLVLPGLARHLKLRPAALPGYRRLTAAGGDFPVLARGSGSITRGLLGGGFDRAQLHRMAHFEGPNYVPRLRLAVLPDGRRLTVGVFLPRHPRHLGHRPWSLARWQRRGKAEFLRLTAAWMAELETRGPYAWDIDWAGGRSLESFARAFEAEAGEGMEDFAEAA